MLKFKIENYHILASYLIEGIYFGFLVANSLVPNSFSATFSY